MELTTKARYGVRIMADLARNNNNFVSITDISKRQDISCKYIEKIIAMLKKNRLVESTRGTNGKPISEALELSNKAVVEALDGLPAYKLHCSVLAEEAVKAAVKDYYIKHNIPFDEQKYCAVECPCLHAHDKRDE